MFRRILRFLLLCLCVLAGTRPAEAQTKANQLIDQMIDALGGQTFLDVKDIHTTGRFFAFTRGQLSGSDIFSDDTPLPIKMQVRRTEESKLHEEQYSNWHKFEGVMTALFVSRLTDNVKTMEIHLDTADYNSGLSDNLFAPPASK